MVKREDVRSLTTSINDLLYDFLKKHHAIPELEQTIHLGVGKVPISQRVHVQQLICMFEDS